MQLAVLLYLASIAENIRQGLGIFAMVFGWVAFLASLVFVGSAITLVTGDKSTDFVTTRQSARLARKAVGWCFAAWVALTLIVHLTPMRKDVYVMAGGYVAMKALDSDLVQGTANKALNSIEHWLDTELARELDNAARKQPNKGR